MKKIVLLILLIIPIFSFGQGNNISINYGLLRTTYYHSGIEVGKKEFKRIIKNDEIAFKEFKHGRNLMTIGNIISAPSIILLMSTIEAQNVGNTPYAWQWIGGISGSIIGSIFYYAGRNKTLEGVKLFNSSENVYLKFCGNNGIGITLSF